MLYTFDTVVPSLALFIPFQPSEVNQARSERRQIAFSELLPSIQLESGILLVTLFSWTS